MTIEPNIPLPKSVTEQMREMKVGGYFDRDYSCPQTPYKQAALAKIKIRTEKLTTGLLRIWRIA